MPVTQRGLNKIRAQSQKVVRERAKLHELIWAEYQAGESGNDIAKYAGMSRAQVYVVIREMRERKAAEERGPGGL